MKIKIYIFSFLVVLALVSCENESVKINPQETPAKTGELMVDNVNKPQQLQVSFDKKQKLENATKIQKLMKENVFEIIHSEFGSEEFLISESKYNIYKTEDGIWEFTIGFDTSKSIKRVKELEEVIDVEPNFEATAIIAPNDLKLEKGKIIFQKLGYDYLREQHLSNVYYFEHNSVEELEIKIIEYHLDWILIEAKGKAIINGSNGNEADAELFIHRTRFLLDKEFKRKVM